MSLGEREHQPDMDINYYLHILLKKNNIRLIVC